MLSKSRQKVVFGEGSRTANIMFVGDAPSSTDDSTGKIFTGRGGDLLTNMIENVLEIKRQDVYLTNILKCHDLNIKDPSPTYTHTCHPYLLKEIELIKPKIIIALGQLAYEYLTGDNSPLEEIHGIVHAKDAYVVIATYHPKYLLKNPSSKKEVFEDLKKIKSLL